MASLEVSDIERPALRVREHTLVGDPEKTLHLANSEASYEKELSTTDPYPEDVVDRGTPTPAPKYSSRWFKRTWDKMVREEKWPRTFYSLVFLILLGVWLGIMIAFGHNQSKHQTALKSVGHHNAQTSQQTSQQTSDGSTPSLNGFASIGLRGTLDSFDPSKRSLTVTWEGVYMPDNATDESEVKQLGNFTDEESFWPGGIAIFRDVEAYPLFYPWVDATNQTLNGTTLQYPQYVLENFDPNNTTNQGIWSYSVDNSTALPIAIIGLRTWDNFDTDIPFSQATDHITREPGFGYPFDKWEGSIVFVATDYGARDPSIYNRTGAYALEIGAVMLEGNTLNWLFTLEQDDTCTNIEGTNPFNVSSFQTTCHMEVKFTAERPGLVMFAATIAVIVNWLSTAFIFILTSESIILRRGYMLEGTDLLSVCFTALFALPSVRLLLPGAPDFGALIDLVGIIPNVIIISLCTCIVCIAKLYRSPEHERARAEKQD